MGLRFDQLPQGITTTGADIVAVMQNGVTRQKTIASLNNPISLGNITFTGATWTLSTNITETRAIGVAAAGTTVARQELTTFSGDAVGTTDIRGLVQKVTASGTNSIVEANVRSTQLELQHTSGTATYGIGDQGYVRLGLANLITGGAVTTVRGLWWHISNEGNSNINTATVFFADGVDLIDGSGTIADNAGFGAGDMGHATRVTSTAIGYDSVDMTAGAPLTAAFRSQMNSGTGKWGFYASGTADNFMEGLIRYGVTTLAANNAQNVTVGNVGPGSSPLAIVEWIKVKGTGGATRYVPLFA